MKKITCFILALSMILLSGCSRRSVDSNTSNTDSKSTSQDISQSEKNEHEDTPQPDYQNKNVVLPKVTISSKNLAEKLQKIKFK